MKFQPQKLVALLLAGLMMLPMAACAKGDGDTETKDPDATQAETGADTGYKPDIAKKNYGEDFTVIGVHTIMKWVVADEDSAGDPFEDTLYERAIRIKDQLGVDVKTTGSSDQEYANEVLRCVQAGDPAYQMVAAHCHIGTANLMSSGAMYDFDKLESVNLDAPYWSYDFMEGLTVNDEYIIGYNDFCLADAACMVVNKDQLEFFNLPELYEDVRNKTWTLEKLKSYASVAAKDNGDGVLDDKDIYGLSGWGWTDLISLMVGSDIKMVARDESGEYSVVLDDNSEKTLNVLTKINELYHAEYGYFWSPGTPRGSAELKFGKGQTLFFTCASSALINLREEAVRFGILPIPLYDANQSEYRSFSWNGVLMVPSVFHGGDPSMVSDTVELLAYYTEPVKKAFYEDLLGTKLAEAPDDAEMLDIVWSTQVTDVAMVTADLNGMLNILYMTPKLCINGITTFSSYLKANAKMADKALDKLFGQ